MLDELTLAKFDKLQAIVDIRWQCHTDEHKQLNRRVEFEIYKE